MDARTPEAAASARERLDRMHDEIRDRICLLDYAPGARLSEAALAAEFGTSRTPLRSVLVRLESEGLVHSVHGVGTFVTDVDIDELAQTYQLRLELAGLTGRLDPCPPDAALRARFAALAARARALALAPDARGFAEINMQFFRALLRLTGNLPLREICERLFYQTTRIWLKSVFASRIDLLDEIHVFNREVEDILRALEIGDLHAAALIQRAHISMSFMRMRAATRLPPAPAPAPTPPAAPPPPAAP